MGKAKDLLSLCKVSESSGDENIIDYALDSKKSFSVKTKYGELVLEKVGFDQVSIKMSLADIPSLYLPDVVGERVEDDKGNDYTVDGYDEKEDVIVLSGHGGSFTIDRKKAKGFYIKKVYKEMI